MTDDSRDRLIRLETEVEHLTKTVTNMNEKLTEVHNLLLQAKGVRWALLAMAGLGGFLASKLGSLMPWILNGPR